MLTVLAACQSSPAQPGDARSGPVSFPGAEVHQQAGIRVRTGERAVFGATTIVNHAATPATLIAGRLVGEVAPGNAVVTDVRVIDLGPAPGSGDLLGAGRWPDRSWRQWWQRAVPIADARLAAHHAAELVFVVEMRREGDWVWPRTAVDYEVAGSRHTATTDFGFQLCPPEPAPCSELTKDDG